VAAQFRHDFPGGHGIVFDGQYASHVGLYPMISAEDGGIVTTIGPGLVEVFFILRHLTPSA